MTTDDDVTIRDRRDADLPELASVLMKVHAHSGYPVEGVDHPLNWLVSDDLVHAWVATIADDVVGHVALSRPTPTDLAPTLLSQADPPTPLLILGRLFAAPDARGRRIGLRLTQTAMAYARQHEATLALDVMNKDTDAARLYEGLGWTPIGAGLHTFGENRQIAATAYVAPSGDQLRSAGSPEP